MNDLAFTLRGSSRHCVLASLILTSNSEFVETVQINYHYKGNDMVMCQDGGGPDESVKFYHRGLDLNT